MSSFTGSVELGKASKTIKEILELGPGSVVELDRLAESRWI
jgi:flagellar motor switch protein FliN/FliY